MSSTGLKKRLEGLSNTAAQTAKFNKKEGEKMRPSFMKVFTKERSEF